MLVQHGDRLAEDLIECHSGSSAHVGSLHRARIPCGVAHQHPSEGSSQGASAAYHGLLSYHLRRLIRHTVPGQPTAHAGITKTCCLRFARMKIGFRESRNEPVIDR